LPRLARIMRNEERLLCSHVDVIRSLRILSDCVDWHVMRHTVELSPGLSSVERHQHARTGCSHEDRFRLAWISRDATGPWIEATVRKLLPTLRRIDTAIETAVCSCQNRGLLRHRIDSVNESVDCVGDNQI